MTTWIYAILSVSLISAASLLAVITFSMSHRSLHRLMFVLISLATGAMLGNGIVHLVPESFEYVQQGKLSSLTVSLLILGGFFLSFILHRVLDLHCHHYDAHCVDLPEEGNEQTHVHSHDHCQHHGASEQSAEEGKKTVDPLGHMSLLSHAMDNVSDGILIGVAYLASIPAGIGMTVAIILHEIPMELGGFFVLVNSGYSKRKAVLVNFLSGMAALAGTISVLTFGELIKGLPAMLTPVGAGVVVYVVASGLIPQLQKERDKKRALYQGLLMLLGVAVLVACKIFEG